MSPKREHVDVCIAGGGVVGSATAYFLAADADFSGSIVVLEPDREYASGATARSVGSLRQQFSTPTNIAISQFAVRFLAQIADYLTVDGDVPHVDFTEGGYLFLATESMLDDRRLEYATAVTHGADVAWLTPAELADEFSWLNTVDLAGGTLGRSGEGWIDPWALLQAFRRKARALGVEYRATSARAIVTEGGRVNGVDTDDGGRIDCGWLVNAAGIRAPALARTAGIDLPVHPRKRCVYCFDCREPVPGLPLTVTPQGLYVRPEGEHFITGFSPSPDNDPDSEDFDVDWAAFDDFVWPTLAERIPRFEAIKPLNAWVGHYDVNTFDYNALLGPHPGCPNLLVATGFSGHGLQQAPAIGRGLAEQIVHGEWRSIDLSPLSVERYVAGEPLAEGKVV